MKSLKNEGAGKKRPEKKRHDIYERYGFIAALLLISVTTFSAYSNTLEFPFHFDDYPYIAWNPNIRDLKNFWPPWAPRYIGFLSFALNYRLWGLNVTAYRLTNIVIHILNAALVYILTGLTLRTPVVKRFSGGAFSPKFIFSFSLAASLIFALHPVHTQAVTYITQRFASLATLFYLTGLILFVRWRLSGKGKKSALYILSLVVVFLAQMVKEIAFTLPFMLILYEFFFFENEGGTKKRILPLLPYMLALAIVPLLILAPESGLLPHRAATGSTLRNLQLRDLATLSPYRYLITQFRVIVTYLRLLVLPVNQTLDYGYRPFDSILNPEVLLSLIFLIVVAITAVYMYRRAVTKSEPLMLLASFGIFWFFLTLSVESSIIPIKDVINEHRLYLPSVGAAATFVSLVFYTLDRAGSSWGLGKISPLKAAVVLVLVTALPLGVASYRRNRVWRSYISLYEDIVKKNPNNARGHNNLGNSYYLAGRLLDAIREYKISMRLNPEDPNPYYNLGKAYLDLGRPEDAEDFLRRALRLRPGDPRILYRLGEAGIQLGHIDEAIESLSKALKKSPDFTDARKRLAQAYEMKGLYRDAAREYLDVLKLEPENTSVRLRLADVYNRLGRTGDAVEQYSIVLTLEPANPLAHLKLGDIYRAMGRRDEAVLHYRRFLSVAPPEYRGQRQRVLEILKKY